MSDALNRSVAPFCHSQDRLGGVAVAIFDRSAGCADEDAVIQQHAFLGSRTACVARHRRVGGLVTAWLMLKDVFASTKDDDEDEDDDGCDWVAPII